jgi:fructuronate reductase
VTGESSVRVSRRLLGGAPPPERIMHLGLGAFFRAHQAWYTARADDASEWGIVAVAGRSAGLAERLAAQDGVYTLVERGPAADRFELVGSVVRTVRGDDVAAFVAGLADPATAILTLTITEAGYRLGPDGRPDLTDPAVAGDLRLLREEATRHQAPPVPATALGRVLAGLDARRRRGAPPLAIVPCDNLPDNGRLVQRALAALAEAASPRLHDWLAGNVSVVSTSVDRITPRAAEGETAAVLEATGRLDAAPVVTEPFADWVLAGSFPAGRPGWETAGARFVDDIEPWELRKLWMLNGAHTLLASAGRLAGHATVADAIRDPGCRSAVERLWDEDARHLPDLDLAAYRAALLLRFQNGRIEHRLDQIAQDSVTKLRVRVVPVVARERASGRPAAGGAFAVAAWIATVLAGLDPVDGPVGAAKADPDPVRALLAAIDPSLAADPPFAAQVEQQALRFAG